MTVWKNKRDRASLYPLARPESCAISAKYSGYFSLNYLYQIFNHDLRTLEQLCQW
jgi:hypothetical protein